MSHRALLNTARLLDTLHLLRLLAFSIALAILHEIALDIDFALFTWLEPE